MGNPPKQDWFGKGQAGHDSIACSYCKDCNWTLCNLPLLPVKLRYLQIEAASPEMNRAPAHVGPGLTRWVSSLLRSSSSSTLLHCIRFELLWSLPLHMWTEIIWAFPVVAHPAVQIQHLRPKARINRLQMANMTTAPKETQTKRGTCMRPTRYSKERKLW